MRNAEEAAGKKRHDLAPQIDAVSHEFSRRVFSEGALPSKSNTDPVAVAYVTQCPYCIRGNTRAALSSARIMFRSHLQNPSSAP